MLCQEGIIKEKIQKIVLHNDPNKTPEDVRKEKTHQINVLVKELFSVLDSQNEVPGYDTWETSLKEVSTLIKDPDPETSKVARVTRDVIQNKIFGLQDTFESHDPKVKSAVVNNGLQLKQDEPGYIYAFEKSFWNINEGPRPIATVAFYAAWFSSLGALIGSSFQHNSETLVLKRNITNITNLPEEYKKYIQQDNNKPGFISSQELITNIDLGGIPPNQIGATVGFVVGTLIGISHVTISTHSSLKEKMS